MMTFLAIMLFVFLAILCHPNCFIFCHAQQQQPEPVVIDISAHILSHDNNHTFQISNQLYAEKGNITLTNIPSSAAVNIIITSNKFLWSHLLIELPPVFQGSIAMDGNTFDHCGFRIDGSGGAGAFNNTSSAPSSLEGGITITNNIVSISNTSTPGHEVLSEQWHKPFLAYLVCHMHAVSLQHVVIGGSPNTKLAVADNIISLIREDAFHDCKIVSTIFLASVSVLANASCTFERNRITSMDGYNTYALYTSGLLITGANAVFHVKSNTLKSASIHEGHPREGDLLKFDDSLRVLHGGELSIVSNSWLSDAGMVRRLVYIEDGHMEDAANIFIEYNEGTVYSGPKITAGIAKAMQLHVIDTSNFVVRKNTLDMGSGNHFGVLLQLEQTLLVSKSSTVVYSDNEETRWNNNNIYCVLLGGLHAHQHSTITFQENSSLTVSNVTVEQSSARYGNYFLVSRFPTKFLSNSLLVVSNVVVSGSGMAGEEQMAHFAVLDDCLVSGSSKMLFQSISTTLHTIYDKKVNGVTDDWKPAVLLVGTMRLEDSSVVELNDCAMKLDGNDNATVIHFKDLFLAGSSRLVVRDSRFDVFGGTGHSMLLLIDKLSAETGGNTVSLYRNNVQLTSEKTAEDFLSICSFVRISELLGFSSAAPAALQLHVSDNTFHLTSNHNSSMYLPFEVTIGDAPANIAGAVTVATLLEIDIHISSNKVLHHLSGGELLRTDPLPPAVLSLLVPTTEQQHQQQHRIGVNVSGNHLSLWNGSSEIELTSVEQREAESMLMVYLGPTAPTTTSSFTESFISIGCNFVGLFLSQKTNLTTLIPSNNVSLWPCEMNTTSALDPSLSPPPITPPPTTATNTASAIATSAGATATEATIAQIFTSAPSTATDSLPTPSSTTVAPSTIQPAATVSSTTAALSPLPSPSKNTPKPRPTPHTTTVPPQTTMLPVGTNAPDTGRGSQGNSPNSAQPNIVHSPETTAERETILLIVTLCIVVLLIVVALFLYCAWRRHQEGKEGDAQRQQLPEGFEFPTSGHAEASSSGTAGGRGGTVYACGGEEIQYPSKTIIAVEDLQADDIETASLENNPAMTIEPREREGSSRERDANNSIATLTTAMKPSAPQNQQPPKEAYQPAHLEQRKHFVAKSANDDNLEDEEMREIQIDDVELGAAGGEGGGGARSSISSPLPKSPSTSAIAGNETWKSDFSHITFESDRDKRAASSAEFDRSATFIKQKLTDQELYMNNSHAFAGSFAEQHNKSASGVGSSSKKDLREIPELRASSVEDDFSWPNSNDGEALKASLVESQHAKCVRLVAGGQYTKLKLIGRGAFGSVFSVMMPNGAQIAMKEMPMMPGTDPRAFSDIEREVMLVTKLIHPNVVRYYGCRFDEQEMKLLLFMEMAGSGSLASISRTCKEAIPESAGRAYLKQVVGALAFIHSKDVVHRDIKCDNVLLTHDGQCKLGDFGTSRAMQNTVNGGTEGAQTLIGTPLFMAPEMLTDSSGDLGNDTKSGSGSGAIGGAGYTKKADIWSFGILCLEFFNKGNPPWPKFGNVATALLYIANGKGSPNMPEGLSPSCQDFIKRCIERDPAKRASATELAKHPWLTQQ